MNYVSTRGQTPPHGFTEAVAVGLAPDGGLFVPAAMPDLSSRAERWESLSYQDLCYEFFRCFATDLESSVLRALTEASHRGFTHPEVAPLVPIGKNLSVLELFHGPTLAFKDFALQLLGNLYEEQIRRTGKPINVLGATSGDTGAAAIHGLLGKEGVNIFILYPDGRVSPLQERQMTCTGADNVFPLAIEGTFDDAQRALKETFADHGFSRSFGLSAVNSINLARILAQCVYYFFAVFRLPKDRREETRFIVPTGNFGNILAGWMARRMGMPAGEFTIATNQNDILHRLFTTGTYRTGEVRPSLAPSMDIQVASNFERFLYYQTGENPGQVRQIMENLKNRGEHVFEDFHKDLFSSSRMEDGEIPETIARIHRDFGYLVDPHTACAFKDIQPDRPTVVLATASPAKFPDTIIRAVGTEPRHAALEALKNRPVVKYPVEAESGAIKEFIRSRVIT